jgi:hypothetical protein
MDPALNTALSLSDVDEVLLRAVSHADVTMRKYIWRGFRPSGTYQTKLMVGDKTADDFVSEALKRFCEGTRKYDSSRSLLDNLNSVTDSLIWSDKKSSDRSGIIDYMEETSEEGSPSDPISTAAASAPSVDEKVVHDEILKAQHECVRMVKASFDGDKEMQDYLEALSEGYLKAADIAELTDIPINKIYELRRKITKYAPIFFGVQSYQDLALKIQKGN